MSWKEFDNSNGKSGKYKVKEIYNNAIYIREAKGEGYLRGLYYLILWKNYHKKKYLRTYIGYITSLKAYHYLLQRVSREANNDLTFNQYHITNCQVNSEA